MVYQLLQQNNLCDYYTLNRQPGINQRIPVRKDKFAFLDDDNIIRQLVSYADDKQTYITFYLPQVHCSSCLYLLEHIYKIDPAVVSSRVNFTRKEIELVYDHKKTSLRKIAELLTSIGYEPYISLDNLAGKKPRIKKSMVYQLGVAGFCFANIMLLSFPEYLGLEAAEKSLQGVFRVFNLILALPVFFYSALPFYESGWKGLKHKFLNIDAPVAFAIIITFTRSIYEVVSGTGAGYFDSMSGIVFFMLAGRLLQDKTYQQLSFERDFTSYFPVAVSVLKENKEIPTALPDIKTGDTLLVHNEELIPADGILTRGQAFIDYSFVTGESLPIRKEMGEIVYAGGKQTGNAIEILVIKEVAQGYLTRLWQRDEFKKTPEEKSASFVHLLSRWFTYIVLTVALLAAVYWLFTDSAKVWNVITAVLIVACPCALLLSNTFTNGNVLRILGRNNFYLRGAQVIEDIANVNHIVFDKTGTLTSNKTQEVIWYGERLDMQQKLEIAALAAQSTHPLSKAIVQFLEITNSTIVQGFHEIPGYGIEGFVNGNLMALGSRLFITGKKGGPVQGSEVFLSVEGKTLGYFNVRNHYRNFTANIIHHLQQQYNLSVISGDNPSERFRLQQMLGKKAVLLFNQSPEDKLQYIQSIQQKGDKVIMLGDGLNDAGALKQSDIGIAVTENSNNFTPASDAILEAAQLSKLPLFIRLCKANKQIVIASFILSIVYNITGIFFAVQGVLSPLIAAILMPLSSLTIFLVTYGSTNLAAKFWKL